jgi:hypothetical protein
MPDEGRYASLSEMTKAERIDRGHLGRLLQLTLLAPAVVEAILDGHHAPDGLGLAQLMRPFLARCEDQRARSDHTQPAASDRKAA